jgi:molybdopterin-dependent oxidoreductase iron-sulfur protein
MEVSRRTFIKTTIVGGAGLSAFGFSLAPVYAQTQGLKIARTTETRSTCPYCSVSCGVIIHTIGDKRRTSFHRWSTLRGILITRLTAARSALKGASVEQEIVNDGRLLKTLGLAPKPSCRERLGSQSRSALHQDDGIFRAHASFAGSDFKNVGHRAESQSVRLFDITNTFKRQPLEIFVGRRSYFCWPHAGE